MKSSATDRFWKLYSELPSEVKKHAREAYRQFFDDPSHPGLHFKRIHAVRQIYSVRISIDFRAIGAVDANEITWFWIGGHADYDHILKKLK
jgi:hypothetical protein